MNARFPPSSTLLEVEDQRQRDEEIEHSGDR